MTNGTIPRQYILPSHLLRYRKVVFTLKPSNSLAASHIIGLDNKWNGKFCMKWLTLYLVYLITDFPLRVVYVIRKWNWQIYIISWNYSKTHLTASFAFHPPVLIFKFSKDSSLKFDLYDTQRKNSPLLVRLGVKCKICVYLCEKFGILVVTWSLFNRSEKVSLNITMVSSIMCGVKTVIPKSIHGQKRISEKSC